MGLQCLIHKRSVYSFRLLFSVESQSKTDDVLARGNEITRRSGETNLAKCVSAPNPSWPKPSISRARLQIEDFGRA